MRILGVDCAYKSYALCVVEYDVNWRKEHTKIYEDFLKTDQKTSDIIHTLKTLKKLYDSIYDIKKLEVHNFIPNKKIDNTTLCERTLPLKKMLKKLNKEFDFDLVLIEYQMSSNFKSREIFSYTYFYFVDKCPTYKVGPSLKNTLAFKKTLRHSEFLEKYSTDYTANKKHAVENLRYWLKIFNKQNMLEKIKKKNHDDAADAFLTIIGYMTSKFPYNKQAQALF